MTQGLRGTAPALALAALLAAAPAARAFVPSPEKLIEAAGHANLEAGRTGPLRLEVALYTDPPAPDVEAIASGTLLSDPSGNGRARLELVGRNGVREVQLLLGAHAEAWRDGQRLEQPRIMVPPLPLLQMRSGRSLHGGLALLGVDLAAADLARSGDHDCFVLGGQPPGVASERLASRPTAWLDSYTFDLVRVDRADGVRFRFGPERSFDDLRLPGWVAVEEEGHPALYLAIRSASRATLAGGDFRAP